MKSVPACLFTVFIGLFLTSALPAQTSRVLSRQSTDSLFSAEKKKALDIKYPIWRAYQYNDKSGRYYLVLSERDVVVPGKDTLITHLEGFCLQDNDGQLVQKWKLKDAIDSTEEKIWFWTKYIEVQDMDKDGYIEPLVIYGSASKDEPGEYHRLKLLLYYKGNKIAIRAETGSDEGQRTLQHDKAFNDLPVPVQSHVMTLLRRMAQEQDFVLPNSFYH